jgi:RNA polymerase sigma-B factor
MVTTTLSVLPSTVEAVPAPAVESTPERSHPYAQRQELARLTDARLLEARDADPDRRTQLLEEVVTSHLWLAETLSRRFRFRGEDEDDLLQVARTGLVEASRRFDPDQGPFLAFAVPTITGVLKRHFRDHGWLVRPPRRTQELASGIWQQWPELVQQLGTIPTERQVAESLGETMTSVRQARYASQGYTPSSLDAAMLHGTGIGVGEEETQRCEARVLVARAWAQLSDAERELLRLRFYEQQSQSEIAAELGTSQMQVSRLLARLLAKLRGMIGALDAVPSSDQVA